MSTAAQHQENQQAQQQIGFVGADSYDPDEVVPRDSPLMTPLRPKLEPSPSPSPDIHPSQVSLGPSSLGGLDKQANGQKIRPSAGEAVLVKYLGDGRNPEIARAAGRQTLPSEEDSADDEPALDGSGSGPVVIVPSLQNLAADALQAAYATVPVVRAPTAKSVPDISISTDRLSLHDDLPVSPYPPRDLFPATELKPDPKPHAPDIMTPGELPPIQPTDSPRSDSNAQMLPSIRSTLGDINRLPPEPLVQTEKDVAVRHGPASSFPRSPPSIGRFPPMTSHGSPPVSPNDSFPRNQLPSPHSLASSPYYYAANGFQHRPSVEYSSSTAGETPSTDQSGSTPATSTSVAERMSIDGITNPQVGHYVSRPHYCSVRGCPRSEGGKGFKRKNEMIRHGLVHDSPGYVCPFCPDREHKYPRPDNLQRHVRVHHLDKDKDDPQLRDVLSQRPDGPNRGRRRRAPAS